TDSSRTSVRLVSSCATTSAQRAPWASESQCRPAASQAKKPGGAARLRLVKVRTRRVCTPTARFRCERNIWPAGSTPVSVEVMAEPDLQQLARSLYRLRIPGGPAHLLNSYLCVDDDGVTLVD